MTPHDRALELIALAREDEQAASVLDGADTGDGPVGFHYQQAVEKLLKALLAARDADFPRTHDLVWLLRLARAEGYAVPHGRSPRFLRYRAVLHHKSHHSGSEKRAREAARLGPCCVRRILHSGRE